MLLRGISTALLGLALLAGAVLPGTRAVDQPWGHACRLAWCDPSPAASHPPVSGLDLLGDWSAAARLAHGQRCARADGPHPAGLPARMVIRTGTGRVVEVPWTYPAPAGSFVFYLCWS